MAVLYLLYQRASQGHSSLCHYGRTSSRTGLIWWNCGFRAGAAVRLIVRENTSPRVTVSLYRAGMINCRRRSRTSVLPLPKPLTVALVLFSRTMHVPGFTSPVETREDYINEPVHAIPYPKGALCLAFIGSWADTPVLVFYLGYNPEACGQYRPKGFGRAIVARLLTGVLRIWARLPCEQL